MRTIPFGASSLVAGVEWLQATVLGTVATTAAVIAVAAVGMMMLTGRIDLRRSATTIMGCFILFGAPAIAAGIQSAAQQGLGSDTRPPELVPAPMAASPFADLPSVPKQPSGYDPYSGASIARQAPAADY